MPAAVASYTANITDTADRNYMRSRILLVSASLLFMFHEKRIASINPKLPIKLSFDFQKLYYSLYVHSRKIKGRGMMQSDAL